MGHEPYHAKTIFSPTFFIQTKIEVISKIYTMLSPRLLLKCFNVYVENRPEIIEEWSNKQASTTTYPNNDRKAERKTSQLVAANK